MSMLIVCSSETVESHQDTTACFQLGKGVEFLGGKAKKKKKKKNEYTSCIKESET